MTVPTVALIDPLWYGHHPMYFSQFTASFLKAGARVIGLCPEPAAANDEAIQAAALRGISDAKERVSMHLLEPGRRSWFGHRFEGDPWCTYQRWNAAAEALEHTEAVTGWKADLVYFPYLDNYLRFLPGSEIPANTIGRAWSGLYLRNHHHADKPSLLRSLRLLAKGDALIRSPLCRGIGVLDERFNESLETYTGKPMASFPDATSTALPAQPTQLARQVIDAARGRKIIGLIGLERRKGVLTFLRVALQAMREERPWYFVCGGIYGESLFTRDERAFIAGVTEKLNGLNLHFDPAAPRIPTDSDFNSLFTTFDVAWTAYEGFHGSSGALTKAAEFGIPSLATAGECIGDRVERHRIGLTIPEGDPAKAVEAIGHLLDGHDWQSLPLDPDYEGYRRLHGLERLDDLLEDLLGRI